MSRMVPILAALVALPVAAPASDLDKCRFWQSQAVRPAHFGQTADPFVHLSRLCQEVHSEHDDELDAALANFIAGELHDARDRIVDVVVISWQQGEHPMVRQTARDLVDLVAIWDRR